jgi:hypothetical protein
MLLIALNVAIKYIKEILKKIELNAHIVSMEIIVLCAVKNG